MTDEYKVKSAAVVIKLTRFLLTQADSRGLTHGEKHYLIQTVLYLLNIAAGDLVGQDRGVDLRNEVTYLDASDIPF